MAHDTKTMGYAFVLLVATALVTSTVSAAAEDPAGVETADVETAAEETADDTAKDDADSLRTVRGGTGGIGRAPDAPPDPDDDWDEDEGPEDLELTELTHKPDVDIARGKTLFMQQCAMCHGRDGRGDGPAARQQIPRPRDFTEATYRLRSTESGTLPTDEDLYRTIGRGMRGTAMPPFGGLASADRWQLVHYIKSLSPRFAEEEPGETIEVPPPAVRTRQLIDRGQKVYVAAQCGQCHGETGRGDGKAVATLVDSKGRPSLPFDMTRGWKMKGGSSPSDIYRTFHTGLDGTPMPAYHDTLSERDSWALVYFVESLFLDRE